MTMTELRYRMSFTTPAFLGNAEQAGQWRTPPIKALLRQWWRVVYAADHGHRVSVAAMLAAEGALFGAAADGDGKSSRSQVRLRLDQWNKGRLANWSDLDSQRVIHPEVKNRDGKPVPVGAHLYLGYGPLNFAAGQTALKAAPAIQDGECTVLRLAFPESDEARHLRKAVWLLQHYGALGGRSRNGWGSFSLTPADPTSPALDGALDTALTMPWREALNQEWPQGIGTDEHGGKPRPLIWHTTEALTNWKSVMVCLAKVKIDLRRQFLFTHGRNAPSPEDRHWLSYPVTNHSVNAWGANARLPNSLRFKVRADADGRLRGVIFHMPCLPPPAFQPDRRALETVWRQVHAHLDADTRLTRIPT
jgi:CRISPR-associated protein Cmr1